jgi:lipoate-protein ligase A
LPSPSSLFDVEPFRAAPRRVAVVRTVSAPTLVLGSTQAAEVVADAALQARGVALTRRRGGGGAVYVAAGDPLWLDAWIPRDDPLWHHDVSVAAEWVGQWWLEALGRFGLQGFEVHAGRAVPGEWGDVVCFAGRGPGEVFDRGRKVVGLSQWRAREGALFSSCAYGHWDPAPLVDLLDVDDVGPGALVRALTPMAAGLGDLRPALRDLASLGEALLGSFPAFGTVLDGLGPAGHPPDH